MSVLRPMVWSGSCSKLCRVGQRRENLQISMSKVSSKHIRVEIGRENLQISVSKVSSKHIRVEIGRENKSVPTHGLL